MNLRPYGDRGLLLTDLEDRERSAYVAAFEQALPPGCREIIVGFDSLLLVSDGGSSIQEMANALDGYSPTRAKRTKPQMLEIQVAYDGPDLEFVAEASGLDVAEVIQLHSKPIYTVRMMGFSPGFPYLEGLDPRLHLERRPSPRNQIAPGSVAIGGAHAGIYSVASPGGWHLLGRTELQLFNHEAARAPEARPHTVFALSSGDKVRFIPA